MNRTWRPFEAIYEEKSVACLPSNGVGNLVLGDSLPVDNAAHQARLLTQIKAGETETVTMSMRTLHEHGTLFSSYLEARKEIFLDHLKWSVSENDGMEFDQYDTPAARWVIVHRDGAVLGGVRMLPTTAKCGTYSYMLRDAQLGILEDLPTDVLFFTAPVEHNVWEATRFFVTKSVPAAQRLHVQAELFRAMSQAAMDNGASHVLGIVPSVWARWARRLGVTAKPIGAPFSIEGTSSQSVLFRAQDFVV